MALYYGSHRVIDYDAWRPFFDEDQPNIAKTGAKLISVMRSVDDPNSVHFVFDIPDLNAFMKSIQSEQSQEKMKNGGVLEPPTMYRLEEFRP